MAVTLKGSVQSASAATALRWGMSAPQPEWAQRISEVGPGVRARRLFRGWNNRAGIVNMIQDATANGYHPVASIKVPNWEAAAAGQYDAQIDALAEQLAVLNQRVAFTIHHEPGGPDDGEGGGGGLEAWRDMLLRLLPRITAVAPKVRRTVIDNGWKFDDEKLGLSDAQLDAIYTDEFLDMLHVFAADTYHGGTFERPRRDASYKIYGMSRFADRRGWTKNMGIGEYNGITPEGIVAAQDAVVADPRFKWACIFNSSENNRPGVDWVLTGDRLAAFQSVLI